MSLLENDLFVNALLTIISFLIIYSIAFLIVKLINKKVENYRLRHKSRRFSYYFATALSILAIIMIWTELTNSIATYIGFLSAGLALALRDVLMDIAGWFLINIRQPFGLGDRVEWANVKGDVIDIRVFYTTILEIGNWIDCDQSTGRLVHLPNKYIFEHSLFNYTRDFSYLWNELKFTVTFESDWRQARELINQAASEATEDLSADARAEIKQMAKKYMIKYSKFTPITYVDVKASGVQITLRYLTSARKRRFIQSLISEKVLERINQQANVELAYPTKRIFRRDIEEINDD